MRNAALIVAAGSGLRFGGRKQYASLGGVPLLRHAVAAFSAHPSIDAVQVMIGDGDDAEYSSAVDGLDVLAPVTGGASRQESVRLGLETFSKDPPENILIHDAARPFPSAKLIDGVIGALATAPGAIPALPVTDTLKRGSGDRISATVDRSDLWRAQTPQGFHFSKIFEAHRAAIGETMTDDAAIAEAGGLEVALVAGAEENFKVTTEGDLARAARAMTIGETRIGSGYDLHRLEAGDHVILCGVKIPFEKSLRGHSDADVALHALTDAILGSIGAGDIGQHFPPSDPAWAGKASEHFVRHALSILVAKGGALVNADVTIICEGPKIGPHRDQMVARLAEILDTSPTRISVKATTTEGVGVTGRGEGIAAQASVSVRLTLGV
jgi:2-C-methyl-D-erythritol 4-phosphate cytidylyltransferase/2-C-methyl-D-erythritol 2,4-cyclodiphosphate synthase